MSKVKLRRLLEPEVTIEDLMCADDPPAPLMPDAEALALMQSPERYAGQPLPAGLWAWAHAQPDGEARWREWLRKVWAATDAKITRKGA